jgi:hypothetical protein
MRCLLLRPAGRQPNAARLRKLTAPAGWPRLAPAGLAGPAAVIAAIGLAVAGAGPAAAASGPATTSAGAFAMRCTVNWVVRPGEEAGRWTDPTNWSTGKVPGPASDVCLTASAFFDVTATGPIHVHSMQVSGDMLVSFTGTRAQASTVKIATVLLDSGAVELDNSSLAAARVDIVPADLSAGSIASDGTSTLTSPGLENHGDLTVFSGTLRLPDALPQLRNGTLAGGSWATSGGQLILPADVTHLAAGQLISGATASVTDPAGHNALTGLTSIGAGGSLQIAGGSLSLTGDLTSAGTIGIANNTPGAGANLTVAGTLTQKRSPTFGFLVVLGTLHARTVLIGAGGRMSLTGTLDGNLVNDGTVEASSGHATTSGSFTQDNGATLVAGFGPELKVAGKATLAGALEAAPVTPSPTPGTRSTAITFSSLAGGFTSHSLGVTLATSKSQIDIIARTQIAVSPHTVAPGGTVTVTGGGFFADTVSVHLGKANGPVLGSARAGLAGQVTITVTIPASTPAGRHKLIANDPGGRHAQATITVS